MTPRRAMRDQLLSLEMLVFDFMPGCTGGFLLSRARCKTFARVRLHRQQLHYDLGVTPSALPDKSAPYIFRITSHHDRHDALVTGSSGCGTMAQAKQAAAAEEAEALSGSSGDTEGFLFGRLLQRRPSAKAELLAFREALLASASGDQKLKVPPSHRIFSRPASTEVERSGTKECIRCSCSCSAWPLGCTGCTTPLLPSSPLPASYMKRRA